MVSKGGHHSLMQCGEVPWDSGELLIGRFAGIARSGFTMFIVGNGQGKRLYSNSGIAKPERGLSQKTREIWICKTVIHCLRRLRLKMHGYDFG